MSRVEEGNAIYSPVTMHRYCSCCLGIVTALALVGCGGNGKKGGGTTPDSLFGVYWVEQRVDSGAMTYDVYTNPDGIHEALLKSTPQLKEDNTQIRVNTMRWSDRSFVGYRYAAPYTHCMSFSLDTGATTEKFQLPQSEGAYISSAEPARCHSAISESIAMQVSERNPTTGKNLNRLLLFKDGSATPQVLLSASFNDGNTAPKMQPVDVAADGRVLAITSQGLVIFSGGTQSILVRAGQNPGSACFSPDGHRVAFSQGGTKPGWKISGLSGAAAKPIPGMETFADLRWADETHVIACNGIGSDRKISLVDIETGKISPLVVPGTRDNTLINDFGPLPLFGP